MEMAKLHRWRMMTWGPEWMLPFMHFLRQLSIKTSDGRTDGRTNIATTQNDGFSIGHIKTCSCNTNHPTIHTHVCVCVRVRVCVCVNCICHFLLQILCITNFVMLIKYLICYFRDTIFISTNCGAWLRCLEMKFFCYVPHVPAYL